MRVVYEYFAEQRTLEEKPSKRREFEREDVFELKVSLNVVSSRRINIINQQGHVMLGTGIVALNTSESEHRARY